MEYSDQHPSQIVELYIFLLDSEESSNTHTGMNVRERDCVEQFLWFGRREYIVCHVPISSLPSFFSLSLFFIFFHQRQKKRDRTTTVGIFHRPSGVAQRWIRRCSSTILNSSGFFTEKKVTQKMREKERESTKTESALFHLVLQFLSPVLGRLSRNTSVSFAQKKNNTMLNSPGLVCLASILSGIFCFYTFPLSLVLFFFFTGEWVNGNTLLLE